MKELIKAKIFGRVQGVGFRYAVKKAAKRLNLTGWVRNLKDGSVEVMAAGNKEDTAEFLEWVRGGTIFARVEEIKVETMKLAENFESFEIKF